MKAVRYAGAAVCLALAAYFMAPLVMGILHIGMVYPAALLALAAAMLLRPRWFRRLPRWLRRTGGALLGAGLALLLVLTGCTPAEPAGPAAEPAAEPVYMALTFDDGPSPSNTPRLLEGLSRRGVRATFFLVGSRIEGREDLVRRIRQEGH